MSGTRIATLRGANVYVNGRNFAGEAEEVTLPDLKPKLNDHNPLSGIGTLELPKGLDKMGMKIKWNGPNDETLMNSADFYTAQDIMVCANSDIWNNDSMTDQVPVTAFLRGRSIGVPPLGIKHQDNPDIETSYTISYYKLESNGVVLWEVDFYAQIYIVNGVDLWAQYRSNLGL